MPSARPSKYFRKGCLAAAAGAVVLLVVFYLLLASGALEGLVRAIVHRATAGQESIVNIYGGASDLFSSTSVDSVVVTNDRGLKVAVYGARVQGSVFDYLFRHSVDAITVDSLVIITAGPSDKPPDTSLSPIFQGTLAGIVTRADRVELAYGRITDIQGTVLVDSMSLDASITSIDTAAVQIVSAVSQLPGIGMVTGSGVLKVEDQLTSLENFQVVSPPGSLNVSGVLHADSTMDFTFSGHASTGFMPDLPFATLALNGHITGSIPRPSAFISVTEGCINYDGLLIGITADTIRANMDSFSVSGLEARTGGIATSISGGLTFADMAWNCALFLSLQNTDVSSYFPDLPETELTGTVSASGYGIADILQFFRVSGAFDNCLVEDYVISSLNLNASGNTESIDGDVSASLGGGTLGSSFSVSLGERFIPVAWNGSLRLGIPDMSIVSDFTGQSLDGLAGFTADLSAEGNLAAFTVSGRTALQSVRMGDLTASGLAFNGNMSYGMTGVQDILAQTIFHNRISVFQVCPLTALSQKVNRVSGPPVI